MSTRPAHRRFASVLATAALGLTLVASPAAAVTEGPSTTPSSDTAASTDDVSTTSLPSCVEVRQIDRSAVRVINNCALDRNFRVVWNRASNSDCRRLGSGNSTFEFAPWYASFNRVETCSL